MLLQEVRDYNTFYTASSYPTKLQYRAKKLTIVSKLCFILVCIISHFLCISFDIKCRKCFSFGTELVILCSIELCLWGNNTKGKKPPLSV